MKTTRAIEGIDEKAVIDTIFEDRNGFSYDELREMRELRSEQGKEGVQTTPIETTAQPENKRKYRKASLEEFRQQFMHVPKIDDRKPIFISLAVRDHLDRIVRLFGERGLSVSGLMENLARHFLETYKDEVEQWRKM